jgi:hypothetical protein
MNPACALLFAWVSVIAPPVRGQATETAKVFTEDAPTVGQGSTEIQVAYSRGVSGRAEVQLLSVAVTHGLRDGLDLSAGLLWTELLLDESSEYARNLGNLQLNAKWRIFESESKDVSISWLPGFFSPFTDPDEAAPGQDFWSLDNVFAATWIPGRFNLSGDAGFAVALGSERASQLWAGRADLGFGYQVTPRFQPQAELNVIYAEVVGRNDVQSLGVSVGAVFNITKGLRLDLGAQEILRGRNTNDGSLFLANLSMTLR